MEDIATDSKLAQDQTLGYTLLLTKPWPCLDERRLVFGMELKVVRPVKMTTLISALAQWIWRGLMSEGSSPRDPASSLGQPKSACI